jgi:glycerol-3-phosphate dehydrogenase
MATRVVRLLQPVFPALRGTPRVPVLDPDPNLPIGLAFESPTANRLLSRYGIEGTEAIGQMSPTERLPITAGGALWAELRWSARSESVRHLDDLLLRRVRIGLTLPEGALPWIRRIRQTVQGELEWSDSWEAEEARYRRLWRESHGLPA